MLTNHLFKFYDRSCLFNDDPQSYEVFRPEDLTDEEKADIIKDCEFDIEEKPNGKLILIDTSGFSQHFKEKEPDETTDEEGYILFEDISDVFTAFCNDNTYLEAYGYMLLSQMLYEDIGPVKAQCDFKKKDLEVYEKLYDEIIF